MICSSSFIWMALVVLVGCAHAVSVQLASGLHDDSRKLSSSTRQLHQALENSDLTLRYADFSTLPAMLPAGTNPVDETPLQFNISITTDAINEPYDVPEGAFHLGQSEVNQIVTAVTTQLVKVPASMAKGPIVVAPHDSNNSMLVGQSVLSNSGLRVPTIFAPEYSDFRFSLVGTEQPPGTTMEIRNMTIVLPDGTFNGVKEDGSQDGLQESGMMDYFDMGTSARLCIINSMFVMKSCEGFGHGKFHVFCCLARTCLVYTQAAYSGLGNTQGEFELLTCHEIGSTGVVADPVSGTTLDRTTGWSTVYLACGIALVLLVVDLL